jgi:hypothetical protein
MRLRALLETGSLGLRLLGGRGELDRTVRAVMTTDLRDPGRYLSGGELVLTGLAWRREAADSERFVQALVAAGVAGLAAGEAELGHIPDDLVAACDRHRLPLFAVSEDVAFAVVTEHVVRQVSGDRAGALAAVVDRHRRLLASGPAGGAPEAVLDLLGSDLDLRAWVLSATGRQIAGPGGSAVLSPPVRTALAGEYLAAVRAGRPAPYRSSVRGRGYSLFPVRGFPVRGCGSGPDPQQDRAAALCDWVLAVEADAGDWPPERLELLSGVTRLIAMERDRRDAAVAVRRRLAQEVLELVQAGTAPAEAAARLRIATPLLLPGLGGTPSWQAVVARLEWEDCGADGPAARAVLEDVLAGLCTDSEVAEGIAVAHIGGEAVALIPLPSASSASSKGPPPPALSAPSPSSASPPSSTSASASPSPPSPPPSPAALPPAADGAAADGDDRAGPGLRAGDLLGAVAQSLSRGLEGVGRLTVGVSAVARSAEALHGALEEARHARRVAAARPGPVCAAGHHELASHVLLLPFVPDDVRRAFTARLLAPLREYDRRHRAELLPTLEAFLDCDGSWTRCAARLHLHVNTLRYRIGRIEQLTGRSLARLEDRLDFFLALRMG